MSSPPVHYRGDHHDGNTFGRVKEAQARGDFDVLAKRERRARRVHLAADTTEGLTALRDAMTRILRSVTQNRTERED